MERCEVVEDVRLCYSKHGGEGEGEDGGVDGLHGELDYETDEGAGGGAWIIGVRESEGRYLVVGADGAV